MAIPQDVLNAAAEAVTPSPESKVEVITHPEYIETGISSCVGAMAGPVVGINRTFNPHRYSLYVSGNPVIRGTNEGLFVDGKKIIPKADTYGLVIEIKTAQGSHPTLDLSSTNDKSQSAQFRDYTITGDGTPTIIYGQGNDDMRITTTSGKPVFQVQARQLKKVKIINSYSDHQTIMFGENEHAPNMITINPKDQTEPHRSLMMVTIDAVEGQSHKPVRAYWTQMGNNQHRPVKLDTPLLTELTAAADAAISLETARKAGVSKTAKAPGR